MKNNFLTLILLFLAFYGFSQVNGLNVYGTLTNPYTDVYSIITLDTLEKAKTLKDINKWYRPSWVKKYIAVEIASTCKEVRKKAVSKNDTLTSEQMDLLKTAGFCKVAVEVHYIPQNKLKDNPSQKMNFSLGVVPIFEAKYPGGTEFLENYLKEMTLDKISKTTFEEVKIATVRFNINEKGEVADAHIFKTSEDDIIDQLMLEAITNMPKWVPAENSKSEKISQEFEFSMGTLIQYGCYKVD